MTNREIELRLERLERIMNPPKAKNIKVQTMFPEDYENRIVSMCEFCERCRKDSVIYDFAIVGKNGNVEQIDLLIGLIDDLANDNL